MNTFEVNVSVILDKLKIQIGSIQISAVSSCIHSRLWSLDEYNIFEQPIVSRYYKFIEWKLPFYFHSKTWYRFYRTKSLSDNT